MRKKILLCLCLAALPLATWADNPLPPPPTMDELKNVTYCIQYTENVAAHLESQSSPTMNTLLNAAWFSKFSTLQTNSSYQKTCSNGVCTAHYDGNDTGCYVASVVQGKPMLDLLDRLTNAYNLMLKDEFINPEFYGFYGEEPACTSANHFQHCNLSY